MNGALQFTGSSTVLVLLITRRSNDMTTFCTTTYYKHCAWVFLSSDYFIASLQVEACSSSNSMMILLTLVVVLVPSYIIRKNCLDSRKQTEQEKKFKPIT